MWRDTAVKEGADSRIRSVTGSKPAIRPMIGEDAIMEQGSGHMPLVAVQ